ncbi:MAG: PilZ domain-containing protein [Myxococcota bacterium]
MGEFDTKRRHDRIDAPTIDLQIDAGERSKRRFLRDLSQGGVYVRTRDVRPIGSEVTLELTPPDWDTPIRLLGEVVRVASADDDGESIPVGMGIRFKDVGPKNQELLAELLSEYESATPQLDGELPDDSDQLKREVRALRARLREAKAMLSSLQDEVETLEEDDDSNRAVIERLARDKKQLAEDFAQREAESQQQLQDKHARELRTILDGYEKRQKRAEQKYVDRIAELETQNAALGRDLARVNDRASHAENDFRELHADLQKLVDEAQKSAKIEMEAAVGEQKARAEELLDRLSLTEARLQKARKKERELRRLVSVMSGESAEENGHEPAEPSDDV